MKSVTYLFTALAATGVIWYALSLHEKPPQALAETPHSTESKAKEPNPPLPEEAALAPTPEAEPHSCKGCAHDTPKDHSKAKAIAEHKQKTWPVVVTQHLQKHYQVPQKAINHLTRAVSYTQFEQLAEPEIKRVIEYSAAVQGDSLEELLHLCWEQGTPPAFQQAMDSVRALAVTEAEAIEPLPVFQGVTRWTRTATDGGGIPIGRPVTITWGFVPDGTDISSTNSFTGSTSNLITTLNSTFGASTTGDFQDAPWFELFETAFGYWAEVTGNTYVYEPNDDGVVLNGFSSISFRGALGVRPDVRIGGMTLDGNSGTLAFNYFPNSGNMVFDTADSSNFTNSNRTKTLFRNVTAHEHGHGLGFSHVCPINRTKLMEPIATRAFIGPQFDDVITAQGIYGDPRERNGNSTNNNTTANASNLSTISDNFETEPLSISRTGDIDIFRFSVPTASQLTVRVIPTAEPAYLEGEQIGSNCSAGTTFNPNNRQSLSIRVLDTDGATVLATSNNQGIGLEETVTNLNLPQSNQDYFIEISGGGENSTANNNAQVYSLIIDIEESVFNFDIWSQEFFGNSTANIGAIEDFDFDGIRNLVEYALGLNPTVADPQQPISQLTNNNNNLSLTFVEDTTLTDIEYIVEVSPTLGQAPDPWTTSGVTLNQGPIVDGRRTVTATTGANITRQFIRLRINRTP